MPAGLFALQTFFVEPADHFSALLLLAVYAHVDHDGHTVFETALRDACEFLAVDAQVEVARTIGVADFESFDHLFGIRKSLLNQLLHEDITVMDGEFGLFGFGKHQREIQDPLIGYDGQSAGIADDDIRRNVPQVAQAVFQMGQARVHHAQDDQLFHRPKMQGSRSFSVSHQADQRIAHREVRERIGAECCI